MLHSETISPALGKTLKDIMKISDLNDYILVGGTALSLRLGHRKSDDIDIFSPLYKPFEELFILLKKHYPRIQISDIGWGARMYIHDSGSGEIVKVDVCSDSADFIKLPYIVNEIRIASLEDIAAMKLQAITTRLVKKDYWDIEELLETFSLNQMIGFYKERYPWNDDIKDVIYRLGETDKCDKDDDPVGLKGKNWDGIKSNISKSLRLYVDQSLKQELDTPQAKAIKKDKGMGLGR